MAEIYSDCEIISLEHNIRITLIMVPVLAFLLWSFKPHKNLNKTFAKKHKLTIMDHIMGLSLIGFLIHNLALRFARGVPHWNFQPCHILTAIFVVAIYHPDNDPNRFLFYFYSVWMPLLGLVFSDPNWYQNSYELPAFHLQHLIMVVGPWYYIYVDRYDFSKTDRRRMLMFAVGGCLTWLLFLVWVSHYYNEDFCALKCRPPFVSFTGTWWREMLVPGCFLLAFLFGPLPDWVIRKISPFHRSKPSLKTKSS